MLLRAILQAADKFPGSGPPYAWKASWRNYVVVASQLTAFRQAGIAVEFHDYCHPVYKQAYSGFISHLSVLDLILNHGPDSRAILMGERA